MRLEWLEPRRVLSAASGVEPATTLDPATFAADRVLVKFRQPVTPSFTASATSTGIASGDIAVGSLQSLIPTSLTSILDAYGASDARRVFPTAPSTSGLVMQARAAGDLANSGDEVPDAATVGLDRWYSFDLAPGSDISEVLAALSADGAVEAAEPDYLFKLSGLLDGPGAGASQGDEVGIASLPSAETDPAYSQQWHLDAVKAPEAWAHLESLGLPAGGSRDVVIAVIDTGVDYTHPDLAANMWVNTREVAGNNRDNDGNGFKNDIHGVSVVSNSWSHTGNPMDDNGHGTHVAGIIAAAANNGIGGTGIAYNSRIMAIKAFQYSGVGASTDIAEAIYYAVENGADIINMSFGSYSESLLVKDALEVAFGTSVLVAAAGNDGKGNLSCPPPDIANMYPAAYNWVLGVMASTAQGDRAPFSNKDCLANDAHEYELLAPGVGVYSTLPGAAYSSWSGTSMAAPVVSGIASLLRTKFADTNIYSSRFIMGQLAIGRGGVIDSLRPLTDTPRPELSYLSHLLFDTTSQDLGNDADGRIDAGETVELAITIRNHWGRADNVTVTLDAFAAGAVGPDPYVTMITDTVNYGAVGTFNEDDNELIYENEVITGVASPFRFSVAAATPNEHIIPFRLTITARNGLDPTDSVTYSFESRFTMSVQRGRVLPTVITEDTTLTKEFLWIVAGPVLVPEGVTLKVDPGTHVQWGTTEPSDAYSEYSAPYIKVEGTMTVAGTYEDPVQLYPGAMLTENVRILNTHGTATITFANIVSPEFGAPQMAGAERSNYAYALDLLENSTLSSNGRDAGQLRWNPSLNSFGFANGVSGTSFAADVIRGCILKLENMPPDATYASTRWAHFFEESLLASLRNNWGWGGSQVFEGEVKGNVFLGGAANYNRGSFIRFPAAGTSVPDANTASDVLWNAFLNPYLDVDVANWTRISPSGDGALYAGLGSNYWGTASETLIAAAIKDKSDDFNLPTVVFDPFLTEPSALTYPFVVKIDVSVDASGSTGIVGNESATFSVTFNRDMDTNEDPVISFGPAFPYTDNTVKPEGAGWVDARTWQGTYNVTPLTGDGYQWIRVAGARASDKPWLVVTGDDTGRFRFEIVTSGTQAMNLQASGGEGKVDLSWTQDDFDLLAGYNIYRAMSLDGTYTRVNSTIIPKEQTAFTDRSVQPGQTYFYKFRIVKTDSTESVDSNVAAAAPLDTIPPVISHTPVSSSAPAVGLTFRADVTDNLGVASVVLHYRRQGESVFSSQAMTLTTGNRYTATIGANAVGAPGVEYYISASDGVTTVYSGLAAQPHLVRVIDSPLVTSITPSTGPATGGTSVTIIGTNFKAGASVTIGGAVASDVVVVSSTQITARTPVGLPSSANVTVVNPDDAEHSLVGGFRYVAEGVTASLPTLAADTGRTLELPLSLANAAGLRSAQFMVTFDPAVLRIQAVRGGALATGWTLAANTTVSGQVTVSMAGSSAVTATGALVYLSFDVIGAPQDSSSVAIASISLNDGAITTETVAGAVTVKELYSLAGSVRYFTGNAVVTGATLSLDGEITAEATTNSSGQYSLGGLRRGDYSVTPAKVDDVRQITAYDASLVLQATVGLVSLSSNQALAADANGVNGVTALDAAYILEKSVGLIPGMLPANRYWAFTPPSLTYTDLNVDRSGQDFTAILIGDVSGNWGSSEVTGSGGIFSGLSLPSVLALGSAVAPSSGGKVKLPLSIERNSNSVNAADLVISYDPSQLSVSAVDVVIGEAGSGMAAAVNATSPGVLRIGLAGTQPLPSDGTLLTIEFTVESGLTTDVPVSLTTASLNEGITKVTTIDGRLMPDESITVGSGQTLTDLAERTGQFELVKRGLGALILDQANSHSGGTVVEAGELIIRNPAALGTGALQVTAGAKVTLDVGTGQVPVARLELSPTGVLDLATGSVVLASGNYDLAAIRGLIASARRTGAWSGPGITSLSIQPGNFREIGYQVLPDGSLRVGYSAVGDANMDRTVSVQDLIALNASGKYGTAATDAGWWQGDFNYDGRVNVTDLIALVSSGLYGAGSYLPASSTAAADLQATGAAEPVLSVVPTGVTLTGYAAPENQPEPIPIEATAAPTARAPEARRVNEFAWAAIANQAEPEPPKDRKVARWRMVGR